MFLHGRLFETGRLFQDLKVCDIHIQINELHLLIVFNTFIFCPEVPQILFQPEFKLYLEEIIH